MLLRICKKQFNVINYLVNITPFFFELLNQKFKIFVALLWTAPELLRLSANNWPMSGTKKGDIFSLGIILSEIVTVDTPYSINKKIDLIETSST